MNLLQEFKNYLFSQEVKPSKVTVKNYLSDVNHFVRWFELTFQKTFTPQDITRHLIENYKLESSQGLSSVSLERHLSSLRKFFKFLMLEKKIYLDPFQELTTNQPADPYKLKEFKNYLYVFSASHLTIKNYLIDIKQFLRWAGEVTNEVNVLGRINSELVEEYKQRLVGLGTFSPATINRKLSSLRKYTSWLESENLIPDISYQVSSIQEPKPSPVFIPEVKEIPNTKYQILNTKYSGFPPFRLLQKVTKGINLAVDMTLIAQLVKIIEKAEILAWKIKGTPIFTQLIPSNLKSYIVNHKPVFEVKNLPKELYAPLEISTKNFTWYKKTWFTLRYKRPNWYKTYHSYAITHYFHFAVLVIFAAGLAFGFYNAFLQTKSPTLASVNPNLPTNPSRILSFQGRLTDNNDNPITSGTNLRFQIYRDSTASGAAVLLWQEVDRVNPDVDGIFNAILGNTSTVCANPIAVATGACSIPQSLFAENSGLWLGVTVENTSELTPRQQIATVAFAANSETLQGLLPITATAAGTTNVVLALNSSGNLVIGGSATPTFQATGGQFTLTGQTLVLSTNAGSNGNVQLAPDGQGRIDLTKPLVNTSLSTNIPSAIGSVEVDDSFSILSSQSGQSALTINATGANAPLISASASGVSKFTVDNNGNLGISGSLPLSSNYITAPNFVLNTSGQITTGTWQATAIAAIYGGTGQTTYTTGDLLYASNTTTLSKLAVGTASQCLIGGTTPSWSSCSTSSLNWWNQLAGALSPVNTTNDLLLGSTATSSALFSFTGIKTGQTIASVSGQLIVMANNGWGGNATISGALTLGAFSNGVIQTTNNRSITIGGNTTGGITLPNFIAQNGVLYGTQTTGILAQVTTASTGLCLVSGASNPGWSTCPGGSGGGAFTELLGAIVPLNSTEDFMIGSQATASAKFSITGISNLSNQVNASLSGQLIVMANNGWGGNATISGALTLGAFSNGVIQTTKNQLLTIGGNTTGDIQFKPGNSSTSLYLSSTGNVGIGTTSPGTSGNLTSVRLEVADADGSKSDIAQRVAGGGWGAFIQATSQNTLTSPTALTTNYTIGTYDFRGYTGNSYRTAAQILGSTDTGTISTTSIPGRLTFLTTPNGSLTPAERMRIDSAGNVGIGTTAPTAPLHIAGAYGSNAALIVNNLNSGDLFTASASGTTKFTISNTGALTDALYTNAGGILYTSTTGLIGQTAIGTGTDCLIGGTTPSFSSCAGATASSIYWTQALGALYPKNSTVDLLVGGTSTASAKFAITGISNPNNQVNASLSGQLIVMANNGWGGNATISGALTLGAFSNPVIQTTANQGLTIGGNTSGLLTLKSLNETVLQNPGTRNIFVGALAGNINAGGGDNVFVGRSAGASNTTGSSNVYLGAFAGQNSNNTDNVFVGYFAGGSAAGAGGNNTAVGFSAGAAINATGAENSLFGYQAGQSITSGTSNIAIGWGSGSTLTTGNTNIIIGYNSGVNSGSLSNSIAIGENATITAANQLVLGGQGAGNISDAYLGSGVTDSSGATSITLNATGGQGTNQAGANLTLAGGKATGNAAGGDIIFQTSNQLGTGTTLQSLSTKAILKASGNFGIGTISPTAPLHIAGAYGSNAALIVNNLNSGDLFTASASGTTKFTISNTGALTDALYTNAGGILYTSTTGLIGQTGIGSGTDCLIGGTTPSFSSCAGATASSIYWTQALGALYPKNSTVDLLVGGTSTASAKFAVLNVNSGNVTATVSGQFIVMPNNGWGGQVGIGTTTPLAKIDIKDTISRATQGSNKITNSNDNGFTTDTGNWTTTGSPPWKINIASSGVAAKDAPGTGVLTLSNSALDSAPVVGTVYRIDVDFITTASSSGSVSVSFGSGTNSFGSLPNMNEFTYAMIVTATSTNALTLTPSAGWYGTVDNVYIYPMTIASMALRMESNNGTLTPIEFRLGGSGNANIFVGQKSGYVNTSGSTNNAFGNGALAKNIEGSQNDAFGVNALAYNTTGWGNTAMGDYAIRSNTLGILNTGVGNQALWNNDSGDYNTALGDSALGNNIIGNGNVGLGESALSSNTSGNYNIAIGYNANVGSGALTNAGAIGYSAVANISNSLILGGTGANAVSVGIGTSSPTTTLDVVGSASLSANLSFRGTGTNYINLLNNSNLFFSSSIGGDLQPASLANLSIANQAQLPVTLNQLAVVTSTINGSTYVYAIGGQTDWSPTVQSTVYKATVNGSNGNIGTFSTTSQGQLPQTVYAHGAITATVGSSTYVYALGGYNGSAGVSSVYKAALNGTTGDVGAFATTSQAQLPTTLYSFSANSATIGSSTYVYVIGGNGPSFTVQSTVYKATINSTTGDVGTFATTSQGQLPVATQFHTATIVTVGASTYIYVIGGKNGTSTPQSTIYRATINGTTGDVGTFATTSQTQLPETLYQHTTLPATISGTNYLYVLAGTNNVTYDHVTVYRSIINSSGNTGTFSTVGQSQIPIYDQFQSGLEQASGATVTQGNTTYIYLIGGYDGNSGWSKSSVYKGVIGAQSVFALTNQNQVGINNIMPSSTLDVWGASPGFSLANFNYTGTDQNILSASSSGTTKFYLTNTGNIYANGFYSLSSPSYFINPGAGNSSTALTINGYAGLGTSSPTTNLDLVGTASISANLNFSGPGIDNVNLLNGSSLSFNTSAGGPSQATGDAGTFSTTSQAQLPKDQSASSATTSTIGSSTYMYVIGGWISTGGGPQSSVYKTTLNGTTGDVGAFSTTSQAQFPIGTSSQASFTSTQGSSTYIYVLAAGSANYSTVYKATLNATTGDVGAFATTSQAQIPQSIRSFGLANTTIGSSTYVYVLGGSVSSGNNASTVYKAVLNSTTGDMGTFSTTGQGQLPQAMWGSGANIVNVGGTNYIYLFGGDVFTSQGGTYVSTVYKATIDSSGNIGTFSTVNQTQLGVNAGYLSAIPVTTAGANNIYLFGTASSPYVYKASVFPNGDINGITGINQGPGPNIRNQYGYTNAIIGGTTYIYSVSSLFENSTVYKGAIINSGPTPALVIKNNGYIGIGTSSPTTNLDIAGSASLSGNLSFIGNGFNYINLLNNNWLSFVNSGNGPLPASNNSNVQPFTINGQGQLPQKLQQFSATSATINGTNYIYVLGGDTGSTTTVQSAVYKASINTATGDVGAFATTSQAQLPQTLDAPNALTATIGNSTYMYVIAGDNNGLTSGFLSTVYKAPINSTTGDVGTFATTSQAQLPQKMSFYSNNTFIQSFGNSTYIYTIGGDNPSSYLSTVYKASINTTTGDVGAFATTSQAQLPDVRSHHSVTTTTIGSSTYIYVIGGYNNSSSQSTVYKATINSTTGDVGAFSTVGQTKFPDTFVQGTATITNVGGTTYIYVLGGYGAFNPYYKSTSYRAIIDSSGNVGTFSTVGQANLPQALNFHQTLTNSVNGIQYIYVIAGSNQSDVQSTVYKSFLGGSNSNSALTISNLGNIGLGVTNPLAKLDVIGSVATQDLIHLASNTGYYNELTKTSSAFATTGLAINLRADDQLKNYDLPFAFPFYGNNIKTIRISTNGVLWMCSTCGTTTGYPSTSNFKTSKVIAPLWADLITNGSGQSGEDVYVDTSIYNQVTIRWRGEVFGSATDLINMSVTLYRSGQIILMYGSGNTNLQFNDPGNGTVGISNGDSINYQYSANSLQTNQTNTNDIAYVEGSNIITATNNNANVFTVDSMGSGYFAGNLGIGTSSPTTNLDIAGSASLSGSLAFNGTGTNNVNLLNSSNLSFIGSPKGPDIPYSPGSDVGTISTNNQAQLPTNLYYHTTNAVTIGGTTYIYTVGGTTGSLLANIQSTVYKATLNNYADISAFSTASQGQVPQVLNQHATVTAVIGGTNYIYVLGGSNSTPTTQSTVYKAAISTSGDVGAFSTASQAQLPVAVQNLSSFATTIGASTYVYVLGGVGGTAQSAVYKATLNGTTGDMGAFATTSQAQLPTTLYEHSNTTATIGSTTYVYVIGGFNGGGVSTVYKATLDTSGNIGAFATTSQAQLPQNLYFTSAVTVTISGTNYIYVFGGYNGSAYQSIVYKAALDTSGNVGTFSTVNQGQLPQLNSSETTFTTTMAAIPYVYVLGGTLGGGTGLSTVYKATFINSANPFINILALKNNGYVGIGTTTPTTNLDIAGSASLSGNLAFNGTGTNNIYMLNNSNLNFMTSVAGTIENSQANNVGTFSTTSQGQLPQGLEGPGGFSAAVGGSTYVYVLGGRNGAASKSTVYKSNINTTTGDIGTFATTSQGQLPQLLDYFGLATATFGSSTYVYVLGGDNSPSTTYSTVYKSNINTTTGDIGTFATTSQGQLPQTQAIGGTVTAAIGSSTYVYVLGGTNGASAISTVYKASFNTTTGDIGTFATTSQSQLPQNTYSPTAVKATIGSSTYIYVLGGSSTTATANVVSTVYKATINGTTGDVGTFATTSQGQLPQSFFVHNSFTSTIGGTTYVYVLGGINAGSTVLSTVYRAAIDTNGNIGSFATTYQIQLPQSIYSSVSVTATAGGTNYVYVLGGVSGSFNNLSTVYKAPLIINPVNVGTALAIKNNGYVGIGTSTPNSLFDVQGAPVGSSLANFNYTGPDQNILSASTSGATQFYLTNAGSAYARSFYDLDNSAYFLDPAATSTSLTTAGNVGVAQPSPSYKLDVFGGNTSASSSDISYVNIRRDFPSGVLNGGGAGLAFTIGRNDAWAAASVAAQLAGYISSTVTNNGGIDINLLKAGTLSNAAGFDWNGIVPRMWFGGNTMQINSNGWNVMEIDSSQNMVLTPAANFRQVQFMDKNRTDTIMVVDTNTTPGRVGIETAVPLATLDSRGSAMFGGFGTATAPLNTSTNASSVEVNIASNSLITLGDKGTGIANPAITLYRTASGTRNGTAARILLDSSNFLFKIQQGTNATNYGAETYTDRLAIDVNGNVGIGTIAPLLRLDVQDTQAATSAARIYNLSNNTGADGLEIKLGNNSTTVVSTTNHFIDFTTLGIGIVGSIQGNGGKNVNYKTVGIADFAEYMDKDPNLNIEWGSVLCQNQSGNVYPCTQGSSNIVGVASEFPSFTGGIDKRNGSITVGLTGVVSTKVSNQNGDIKSGDYITYSDTPGVGVKATKAGQIIGIAMSDYNSNNEGKIYVTVNPTWYDPQVQLTSTGDLNLVDNTATVDANFTIPHYFSLNDTLGNPIDRVGAFAELAVAKLKVGLVDAQQITTNALSVTTENITIGGQSLRNYIASIVSEILNTTYNIQNTNIISPIASINTLNTNLISPIGNDSKIALKLSDTKFEILNTKYSTGSAVSSFDNQGNATFSGQLSASSGQFGDATISGTLHAGKILASDIVGLNIQAATISANYITNNYYASASSNLASSFPTLSASPSGTNPYTLNANNYISVAPFASELAYVKDLSAATATFSQGLMVFGSTTLSDTSIVGQLSVNGSLILANNSINVLGSDLNLQPLRQGGLSIMAGLFYIDTNGNVTIGGDTTIKGTLYANIISPIPGNDLTLRLASGSGILDTKYKIQDTNGSDILSINQLGDLVASGAGTFSKLNLGLVEPALAVSPTEIIATGSAGTGTINAGRTQMTIDNKLVTDKSLIYITPTSSVNQSIFLLRQVPGISFTVGVQNTSLMPIKFNWIIVN